MEKRAKDTNPGWLGRVRNAGEPQEKGSLGRLGLRIILSPPAQLSLPPFHFQPRVSSRAGQFGEPLRHRGPPQWEEPGTGRPEAWVPVLTGSVTSGREFLPSRGLIELRSRLADEPRDPPGHVPLLQAVFSVLYQDMLRGHCHPGQQRPVILGKARPRPLPLTDGPCFTHTQRGRKQNSVYSPCLPPLPSAPEL